MGEGRGPQILLIFPRFCFEFIEGVWSLNNDIPIVLHYSGSLMKSWIVSAESSLFARTFHSYVIQCICDHFIDNLHVLQSLYPV